MAIPGMDARARLRRMNPAEEFGREVVGCSQAPLVGRCFSQAIDRLAAPTGDLPGCQNDPLDARAIFGRTADEG